MKNLRLICKQTDELIYVVRAGLSVEELRTVIEDPRFNRTFLDNPGVHTDAMIGCWVNEVFMGAMVCQWAVRETQHMEIHLAMNRVDAKLHIPALSELAVLWCLMQGWRPCTAVPDNQIAVKRWLENRHGLTAPMPIKATKIVEGEEVTSSLYVVPDDWHPNYLTHVLATFL